MASRPNLTVVVEADAPVEGELAVEYQASDGQWHRQDPPRFFLDEVGAGRHARAVCVFWRVVDAVTGRIIEQGPSR